MGEILVQFFRVEIQGKKRTLDIGVITNIRNASECRTMASHVKKKLKYTGMRFDRPQLKIQLRENVSNKEIVST